MYVSYRPGNLTVAKEGLLLSEGLDCRLVATSGQPVQLNHNNGQRRTSSSLEPFHGKPDGAMIASTTDGGWVYVSNSELDNHQGGVGAIYFDADGSVIDYQMLLTNTSMNCGGGKTPWNTWISCEEVEFTGQIYQVDPLGLRDPELITLGSDGGRWESFAYDDRNQSQPYFFATEDHNKGTVRRFTPDPAYLDWETDPWSMLTAPGITDYLELYPNATNNGGTFAWTDDILSAKNNARAIYPQTEGIDVDDGIMYFVCKNIRQVFCLDLDAGTYWNTTTLHGLFDGKPDQMQRLLHHDGTKDDLLYFTEEGELRHKNNY